MNYIQQAFKVKHDFWRYLIGSLIVFIAAMIGQIPFTGAVFFQAAENREDITKMTADRMMQILEPNMNLFLMLISFVFAMLALYFVVKLLHKQTMTSLTTTRKKIDWKRIWFAFIFWGIISSGLVLLDYYFAPEDYVYNFEWQRFAVLAVIAIVLVPIQTSVEEYIFRGYLMQGFGTATKDYLFPIGFIFSLIGIPLFFYLQSIFELGLLYSVGLLLALIIAFTVIFFILKSSKALSSEGYKNLYLGMKKRWVPLLITSLIFGGLHIANPEVDKLGNLIMIYYIGTGLFLGIITLMDEGLELALGFHAANNLFTALLVTADWTAFQTHSILKDVAEPELGFIDLALPVFIIFPILLFIFAKKYKWTNWKDKLFGTIEELPAEDYQVIGEDLDSSL